MLDHVQRSMMLSQTDAVQFGKKSSEGITLDQMTSGEKAPSMR